MKESSIQNKIMVALGKIEEIRIFRNNVGLGWCGKILRKDKGIITLSNPRPLHCGLFTGSSDLIGLRKIVITSEMVGSEIAQFISIEVKSDNGIVSDEQKRWIEMVNAMGGLAGVVKSPDEAVKLVMGK